MSLIEKNPFTHVGLLTTLSALSVHFFKRSFSFYPPYFTFFFLLDVLVLHTELHRSFDVLLQIVLQWFFFLKND